MKNSHPFFRIHTFAACLLCGFCAMPLEAQRTDGERNRAPAPTAAEPQAAARTVNSPPEVVPALPVPRLVKFSGTVIDASGQPRTGLVGLTFSLYKEQEGGATLWMETHNVELDPQGRYSVLLGSQKSAGLPLELFASGEPRWLGVKVESAGEVEQPRVLLVSVPYAMKAADAETLGGRPASDFLLTDTAAAAGGVPPVGHVTPVFGAGSTGALAVFTASNRIGSSGLLENNGLLTIGTSRRPEKLQVFGGITISGAGNGITFPDGTTQTTANVSGAGTVKQINTGTGILGGPITTTGTLSLDTAFTDARYLQPNGNGSGLTNVNAATLGGLPASTFAQLGRTNIFTADQVFKGNVKIGEPTFFNQNGSLALSGNIATCGAPLTVVASGDVLSCSGTSASIDTSSTGANGGNLLMVAGAKFSSSGPAVPEAFSFGTTVTNNGTPSAAPILGLSFGGGGNPLSPTGFFWNSDGTVHFPSNQTFPVSSLFTPGFGLTLSSNNLLSVDPTVVGTYAGSGTWTGANNYTGLVAFNNGTFNSFNGGQIILSGPLSASAITLAGGVNINSTSSSIPVLATIDLTSPTINTQTLNLQTPGFLGGNLTFTGSSPTGGSITLSSLGGLSHTSAGNFSVSAGGNTTFSSGGSSGFTFNSSGGGGYAFNASGGGFTFNSSGGSGNTLSLGSLGIANTTNGGFAALPFSQNASVADVGGTAHTFSFLTSVTPVGNGTSSPSALYNVFAAEDNATPSAALLTLDGLGNLTVPNSVTSKSFCFLNGGTPNCFNSLPSGSTPFSLTGTLPLMVTVTGTNSDTISLNPITNANVDPTANIDPTKIAGTAATLTGAQTFSGPNTFQNGTTFTGLTTLLGTANADTFNANSISVNAVAGSSAPPFQINGIGGSQPTPFFQANGASGNLFQISGSGGGGATGGNILLQSHGSISVGNINTAGGGGIGGTLNIDSLTNDINLSGGGGGGGVGVGGGAGFGGGLINGNGGTTSVFGGGGAGGTGGGAGGAGFGGGLFNGNGGSTSVFGGGGAGGTGGGGGGAGFGGGLFNGSGGSTFVFGGGSSLGPGAGTGSNGANVGLGGGLVTGDGGTLTLNSGSAAGIAGSTAANGGGIEISSGAPFGAGNAGGVTITSPAALGGGKGGDILLQSLAGNVFLSGQTTSISGPGGSAGSLVVTGNGTFTGPLNVPQLCFPAGCFNSPPTVGTSFSLIGNNGLLVNPSPFTGGTGTVGLDSNFFNVSPGAISLLAPVTVPSLNSVGTISAASGNFNVFSSPSISGGSINLTGAISAPSVTLNAASGSIANPSGSINLTAGNSTTAGSLNLMANGGGSISLATNGGGSITQSSTGTTLISPTISLSAAGGDISLATSASGGNLSLTANGSGSITQSSGGPSTISAPTITLQSSSGGIGSSTGGSLFINNNGAVNLTASSGGSLFALAGQSCATPGCINGGDLNLNASSGVGGGNGGNVFINSGVASSAGGNGGKVTLQSLGGPIFLSSPTVSISGPGSTAGSVAVTGSGSFTGSVSASQLCLITCITAFPPPASPISLTGNNGLLFSPGTFTGGTGSVGLDPSLFTVGISGVSILAPVTVPSLNSGGSISASGGNISVLSTSSISGGSISLTGGISAPSVTLNAASGSIANPSGSINLTAGNSTTAGSLNLMANGGSISLSTTGGGSITQSSTGTTLISPTLSLSAAGGDISLATSASGGNVTLTANGSGSITQTSGGPASIFAPTITLQSSSGGIGSSTGGSVFINNNGAVNLSASSGGSLFALAGQSCGTPGCINGGDLNLNASSGVGGGNGGNVFINSGVANSTGGTGGKVTLQSLGGPILLSSPTVNISGPGSTAGSFAVTGNGSFTGSLNASQFCLPTGCITAPTTGVTMVSAGIDISVSPASGTGSVSVSVIPGTFGRRFGGNDWTGTQNFVGEVNSSVSSGTAISASNPDAFAAAVAALNRGNGPAVSANSSGTGPALIAVNSGGGDAVHMTCTPSVGGTCANLVGTDSMGKTTALIDSEGNAQLNSLTIQGASVKGTLAATTGSIGGITLTAGACNDTMVSVPGATNNMAVSVSPAADPGPGITWNAFVSAANTVIVRLCGLAAVAPAPTTYNVRVIQ